MTIKEIRKQLGLSQREFAQYFDIPLNTIRNWEQETREPAPYIPKLLERIITAENK